MAEAGAAAGARGLAPVVAVLGTDTGVGKTYVTCSLARALEARGKRVAIQKPFASGITPATPLAENDPALLAGALRGSLDPEQVSPHQFALAAGPMAAAAREGRELNLAHAAQYITNLRLQCDVLLLEGVGGCAVPLTDDTLFSDFVEHLAEPVAALLVARTTLGTVNHTLLSIEHLRARSITVLGVLLNQVVEPGHDPAEQTATEQLLPHLGGIPLLGPLPYRAIPASATSFERDVLPHLPVAEPALLHAVELISSR